jgi:uncharacterized protein (TIGR02246 family)
MMKNIILFVAFITCACFLHAQNNKPTDDQQKAITSLIDKYSEAREKKDTALLKVILTEDVDQLVSTGEWRNGIAASVEGMLKSSASTPGTRTLTIEKTRMLTSTSAIVDCRYEIQNTNGTIRKMWSTFVVVENEGMWKISAIRNMLPAGG